MPRGITPRLGKSLLIPAFAGRPGLFLWALRRRKNQQNKSAAIKVERKRERSAGSSATRISQFVFSQSVCEYLHPKKYLTIFSSFQFFYEAICYKIFEIDRCLRQIPPTKPLYKVQWYVVWLMGRSLAMAQKKKEKHGLLRHTTGTNASGIARPSVLIMNMRDVKRDLLGFWTDVQVCAQFR